MDPLPIAPSCSLNTVELSEQRERYRAAGKGAELIERKPRRQVVKLGDGVPGELVEELIKIESDCCPFFDLDWEPSTRRLTISVPDAEHEPALDAVGYALGFG